MEPSDFLTILGLAVTIWAIIPSKERAFVMLFFSKLEILTLFGCILLMHIQMSFDFLLENWIPQLTIFTHQKGLDNSIWAYITAILTITYPVYKVNFCFYSRTKIYSAINLYEECINKNDIDLLIGYIRKYHQIDIHNYLNKNSNSNVEVRKGLTKKSLYAERVYERIICNEKFISLSANKYPVFFSKIIESNQKKNFATRAFFQAFLKNIFINNNQDFINELKIKENSNKSIQELKQSNNLPILNSLFSNIEMAEANYVWYAVGHETIKSLKHDTNQIDFLITEYDDLIEDKFWETKIYLSKVYFDTLVRETILSGNRYHMWLHYFSRFTGCLIELIPEENSYNHNSEYPSFTHKILNELQSTVIDWIEYAEDLDTTCQVIDSIQCLGDCLSHICQAQESKLNLTYKISQFNNILILYFDLYTRDTEPAILAKKYLEELFLNKRTTSLETSEKSEKYLEIFQKSWDKFDKVPFQHFEDNGSIDHFSEAILKPLGLKE
jgi:hypothetical protein